MTRAVEIAVQLEITIVFIDDTAFQVTCIGGCEWGISLMLGFMSILLGALICLLRNQPFERLFILARLLLKPRALPQFSHSHTSHITHHGVITHPLPPPPNPLCTQSHTRIHRRNYIIHTLPTRRSHQHLAGARMVWNHSHTRNGRRKTRLRAHMTTCARYTTHRD